MIDPKTLTVEEINEASAKILSDPLLRRFYSWSIDMSRTFFAPPAQPEPKECRHCCESPCMCAGGPDVQPEPKVELPDPSDWGPLSPETAAKRRAEKRKPEPTAPVGNEDCQKAKAEGPWLAGVLKPAAPEREMPEAVDKACDLLEWGGNISAAAALRAAWRSQPVAVGISEELDRRAVEIGGDRLVGVSYRPMSETVAVGTWQLEELLKYADLAEVALRTGFHPPEFLFRPADRSLRQVIDAVKKQRDEQRTHAQPVGITREFRMVEDAAASRALWHLDNGQRQQFNEIADAIAAVREQYANAQPRPKLEKVRVALEASVDRMQEEGCDCNEPHDPPCALCLCKAGLDELDAAEGRKP